jgi:tripartite-type tricarboxylate transporter receptor subunit TctC
MKRNIAITILSFALGLSLTFTCWAADYPSQNIKTIIPYGQGGGSDLGTKIITNYMGKYLGVSFVPIYKPGAGTTIAVKYLMKAKPDGYTILSGAADVSVTFYPKVIKGADYGVGAITPILQYSEVPMVMVVKADAPWKTLKDFIDDAKKNPNKFKHGSYGATSMSHFCMALMNKHAGIQTRHVPFKSTGKALTAMLGGHVDIVPATSLGGGLYKAGKIRALAAALPERTDLLPGVPTLKELGFPIVMSFPYMMWVPKGTPQNLQDVLINAAKRAYKEHSKALAEAYANLEMTARFSDQKGCEKIILERDKGFNYIIDLLKVPTYRK